VARADGKLFHVLADETCREILAVLLRVFPEALTQRQLIASLGLTSSTASRRLGELEDLGVVERASSRAPYTLVFEEQTRSFMVAGLQIAAATAARVSLQADTEAQDLIRVQTAEAANLQEAGDAT
jgi:DNA-binding Lrp family transcriptional regulator